MELMQKAASIAMLIFVLSSMLAMGLDLTVGQIIAPLRNVRLVMLSLLANFVLMPLGCRCTRRPAAARPAAGRGTAAVGLGGGRTVPTEIGSDGKGQLSVRRGLDGAADGCHGRLSAARPSVIAAGSFGQPGEDCPLTVSAHAASSGWRAGCKSPYFADVAARTKPVLDRVSNLSLILLVLLITAGNVNNVLAVFGTGGILAGLLFIAIGFGIGWVLGGPDLSTRRVLALGTAQRNIAAALVVGSQSFSDPKVVVMVVVVAIVGLLILMPLSRMLANSAA